MDSGAAGYRIVFTALLPDRGAQFASPADTVLALLMMSPLWLPLAFAGYAMGRRGFSNWLIFAMIVGEALSIGAMVVAIWIVFPH